MLPINSALKPAVEWASPCPWAAAVSGAGTTTSLVMGGSGLKMLHCPVAKRGRLIVLRLKHSLALFWCHAMQKMHASLNRHLGPYFDHPPGRNLEIVGGVVGRPAHRDEQMVLP